MSDKLADVGPTFAALLASEYAYHSEASCSPNSNLIMSDFAFSS